VSETHTPKPWLLAIDTSTDLAGVAGFDGTGLALASWASPRRQTQSIQRAVEAVMGLGQFALNELLGVAIAIGPGSFTGLRVGLAFAKGLAIMDERAVIGVPTLELAAWPLTRLGAGCVAVIPAGRGRVVWSHFGSDGESDSPTNSSFAGFRAALDGGPPLPLVGELPVDQVEMLRQQGFEVRADSLAPRVEALATIGWQRLQNGDVDDVATLEPLYLHGNPNPR